MEQHQQQQHCAGPVVLLAAGLLGLCCYSDVCGCAQQLQLMGFAAAAAADAEVGSVGVVAEQLGLELELEHAKSVVQGCAGVLVGWRPELVLVLLLHQQVHVLKSGASCVWAAAGLQGGHLDASLLLVLVVVLLQHPVRSEQTHQ